MGVYAWLVADGLWRDVLASAVAILIAHAVALVTVSRALRRHRQCQARIADLLDTDTPGGLHDVLHEIKKSNTHAPQAPSQHSQTR